MNTQGYGQRGREASCGNGFRFSENHCEAIMPDCEDKVGWIGTALERDFSFCFLLRISTHEPLPLVGPFADQQFHSNEIFFLFR